MPSLIPSLNSCVARMTSGEKRFAVRLEQKLNDDCLIWYDVPIGKKQLHPDFIVLHPLRGLLVLEVKDWKIDMIKNVTRSNWTIANHNTNAPKQVKNPLEQARNYVLHAAKLLERDADLVHMIGSEHAGKCIVPYGYGVVFTNITRAVFDRQGLGDAIASNLVICKDEILDRVDEGEFRQRLWDMFPYQFERALTPHQVNRICWHIFPEITIQKSLLPEIEEDEVITPVAIAPDLIKIIDLQQEQLLQPIIEPVKAAPPINAKTQLQQFSASLLHIQTNFTIEIPAHLSVVHIGKPNTVIPPDIDVSDFPDSEIVSRIHADVRAEGGGFYFEDKGSSNGTYVNNLPLSVGNRHKLRAGDRISLGKGDKVSFVFQLNS